MLFDYEPDLENYSRIAPIYPLTKGLSQSRIRKIMIDLLKNIDLDNLNFFDQGFLASYDLEQVSKSLLHVHLPSNDDEILEYLLENQTAHLSWSSQGRGYFLPDDITKKIEDKIKTIDIDTAPKKIFKGLAGRLAKRGYGKARK